MDKTWKRAKRFLFLYFAYRLNMAVRQIGICRIPGNAMALPMGELSAKLTERALRPAGTSPKGRGKRAASAPNFQFVVSMDSQLISIFGIFSRAVPLPSHKPEKENAVIAERCYESAMTALFQLTADRRGTFFLSHAILEHNPPMKGECLWGIWMCLGSGRCGSG